MATPQETRDRINEMRARIFNEASPDPVPNKAAVPNKVKRTLRENNSVEHNATPSQKNGASSVTAQIIDFQADTFVEKLKHYDNRISSLSDETQNKLAELNLLYDSKINDLEESLLNKLESALDQNSKKINAIEESVSKNTISSSLANKNLNQELDEQKQSFLSKINSIEERFLSTNQNIDSLAEGFSKKFQHHENKTSSLNSDVQSKLSKIAQDLEDKNRSLEKIMFDKLEHISNQLKNVEEKIDSKIDDVNTSILNEVSSIRASHGQKFDALEQEVNLLDEKLQTDNDEVKALVLDQKTLLEKTISDNIAASNKQMDAQLHQIEDRVKSFEKDHDATTVRLSEEIKSLSGELTILSNLVKEKHFEIASHVDINMSTITKAIENDREYFNHKLQTASDNIQAVESMIVKEGDLTKLFQNYTLNVNIRNDAKPSKFNLMFKKIPLLSTLKKLLPAKAT